MSDWWNQPMTPEPEAAEAPSEEPTRCPWCSAAATPGQPYCACCGAVMAQHDSLGGLVIPGVTDVEAGLGQPSTVGPLLGSQARVNTITTVSLAGGPSAGLATAAMMLVRDSAAGMFREAAKPESVGRPSQAAMDMANRLRSGPGPGEDEPKAEPNPWSGSSWTEPEDPA